LVYNTGGYDSIEALGLLDGIIDIYMPRHEVRRFCDCAQILQGPELH
jgi:uncharacterized Fe-S radical SAM superfamily protein PflX